MKYRWPGATGLEVSKLCLGTWRFGQENGGSGVVGTDREEFVIASKCYWPNVSRFQETLSRKNVGTVDVDLRTTGSTGL